MHRHQNDKNEMTISSLNIIYIPSNTANEQSFRHTWMKDN